MAKHYSSIFIDEESQSADEIDFRNVGYLFNDSDEENINYNHADSVTVFPSNLEKKRKEEKKEADELSDERDKWIVPGLVGLHNLGNTCYMNSGLQALSVTPLSVYLRNNFFENRLSYNMAKELASKKRKKKGLKDDAEVNISKHNLGIRCSNSITYQLARLQRAMWNNNCIITPKTIKKIIGRENDEFRGYGQNDSQELISFLIDKIHEETKNSVDVRFCNIPEGVKKLIDIRHKCSTTIKDKEKTLEEKEKAKLEYEQYKSQHRNDAMILDAYIAWRNYIRDNHSIITDLFTGMFCSVVEPQCGNKSVNFEPFTSISIETAPHGETTLEQCLKDFSSEDILKDQNMYHCEICNKKEEAKKNMYIWESPETLIIHLKRFKTECINNVHPRTFKTNSTVKFPIEGLKLTDNYMELSRTDGVEYNLKAIILHLGSYYGGHYIAYCNNPINNEWYEFNDRTVVHIPREQLESEIVTKDAYVLIYQKDRNSHDI